MENLSLSYREVLFSNLNADDWQEVVFNTGGTQSTLQDIKVSEKAGGYNYKNIENLQNRNRFIYWRSYQDILEVSEISLDITLYQNSVRFKFSDSPVLSVSIAEQKNSITLLVATVSSIHCMNFPHQVIDATNSEYSRSGGINFCDSQSLSIFRDANSNPAIHDASTFHVIDPHANAIQNHVPHAAFCYLAPNGENAYYALAYQSQLMLYVMNCASGNISTQQLKVNQMMPRLLMNLKGALTGKNDSIESAISATFHYIDGHIYLLTLYRNDDLRVWSTSTLQPVCTISCRREDYNAERAQGPQSNMMRKINEKSVCIFLSYCSGTEFLCIDIGYNATELNLIHRKRFTAPQMDLAEFDVTETRIWALWSNADGEFNISNLSLNSNPGDCNWISSAMEPPPDRYCVAVEQGIDPREAYCSYIFRPGKFERAVIAKALYMFRRANIRFDINQCTISTLKEHVCQAVEDEIQNEIKEFVVSDEEYLEIASRLWSRFYSCCEQYHLKASQPIGLLVLENIDAVCVIKKHAYSLLRPCEMLEHLMLISDNVDISSFISKFFANNQTMGKDFICLVKIISQFEKWLPEDIKLDIDKRMYQLEAPKDIVASLTADILSDESERAILPKNFFPELRLMMAPIADICCAISFVLNSLRLENEDQEEHLPAIDKSLAQSTNVFSKIGALFGSDYGLSLLSETVRQTAMIRFSLCRNLIILQQILIDARALPLETLQILRSQLIPDTIVFLQSYYVIVWISETPVNITTKTALDTSVQRLHRAQLHNGVASTYITSSKGNGSSTLLHLFLKSTGLQKALKIFVQQTEGYNRRETFQETLLPLISIIGRIIWVISFDFTFGEWLFGTCQHIVIDDYVRLLSNWCEWNLCSRKFILAVSLLDCAENQKAFDMFLLASKGILKEKFLFENLLKNTSLYDQLESIVGPNMKSLIHSKAIDNQAISIFFLKIIQLFEQHNALDYIIAVADVAINLLGEDNAHLPMFQSIVFNNHLILEHYEEAYHALVCNAEFSRRKDCLRQLVIILFQRKRLDLLMQFPYVGLRDEFENIVESRARSLVIDENEIYNFLYSFHINNGNMRKASAAMYEQAMRLRLESDAPDAMEKRCASLLACMNVLHLIDARYRWIAKPNVGEECSTNQVSKKTHDTTVDEEDSTMTEDNINDDLNRKKPNNVVVLEIADIQRELLHTEALIHLVQNRKDINSYLNAGAEEISYILATCGLFSAALKLANGFNVTLLPIFESLTTACVRTAHEDVNEAWGWLQENDLADLPHRNKAADMAWAFLQKVVVENELRESTQIRKTVVNKLLSLNAFIPQWLYNNYKLHNCPELLYLFVKHNRLLEAAELAQEMIAAMLGAGSEYFSFKHPVAITNAELCLPVHTIDLLLHGLKLNGEEDIEYKQASVELDESLHKYIDAVLRTTEDKIELSFRRNLKS